MIDTSYLIVSSVRFTVDLQITIHAIVDAQEVIEARAYSRLDRAAGVHKYVTQPVSLEWKAEACTVRLRGRSTAATTSCLRRLET